VLSLLTASGESMLPPVEENDNAQAAGVGVDVGVAVGTAVGLGVAVGVGVELLDVPSKISTQSLPVETEPCGVNDWLLVAA
jgi:hypothetical protein